MLRVTGRVVRTNNKNGAKVDQVSGEVKPWSFDIITVLVAEQAIVEVQRFSSSETPCPSVGDAVDFAVSVEVYRNKPSYGLDKPWAALFPPVPAKHSATAA